MRAEDINLVSSANADSKIKQVSAEIKVYAEADHTSGASDEILAVWEELKEQLSNWDDVTCYATKHYVGFKKGSSLFAAVRIFKKHMNIDFSRGNISVDGQKSKAFLIIDDPKEKLEEKSWTYKSGIVGNSYLLKLSNATELEYAKYLIKQKYDKL